jgi:hypothetical protein
VRRKENKDKKLVSVNRFAICDKFTSALLAHQIFYFENIVKEKILKKSSEAKKWKMIYVRIKRLSNFWFILKTQFFAVFQKSV